LVHTAIEGKDTEADVKAFEKKVDEMLAQMKPGQVKGFDMSDKSHAKTLRQIRALYALNWASYILVKLSEDN